MENLKKSIEVTEEELKMIINGVSNQIGWAIKPDKIMGITITGYPTPEYYRKKVALDKSLELLEKQEAELLELSNQAEEYIENIRKSELRTMFRIFFIDNRANRT